MRAQCVAVIPASSAPKSRQAPLKILHLCFQFLRNRNRRIALKIQYIITVSRWYVES